jgi:hypothetical protein
MKYVKVFQWLSVVLVVAVIITAVGCGKKETSVGQTPTPTATPTATISAEPTGETGTLSSLAGNVTVMRHGAVAWIVATSGMNMDRRQPEDGRRRIRARHVLRRQRDGG